MRRGHAALAAFLLCLAAAGCGGADGDALLSAPPPTGQRLERNGISLVVPDRWDGRVLFRESSGRHGVIFQVANFTLPPNAGLEPPRAAPLGAEDPIKAMSAGDVLVTLTDGVGGGARPPRPITVAQLTPVAGPRVPHGHSLASGSFCFADRCVHVEAEFGSVSARPIDVDAVDAVLASLTLAP
jgi:hypothetical protein